MMNKLPDTSVIFGCFLTCFATFILGILWGVLVTNSSWERILINKEYGTYNEDGEFILHDKPITKLLREI